MPPTTTSPPPPSHRGRDAGPNAAQIVSTVTATRIARAPANMTQPNSAMTAAAGPCGSSADCLPSQAPSGSRSSMTPHRRPRASDAGDGLTISPQGVEVSRDVPRLLFGDTHVRHGGIGLECRRIADPTGQHVGRSEEHTSELQSLMRHSYAVF